MQKTWLFVAIFGFSGCASAFLSPWPVSKADAGAAMETSPLRAECRGLEWQAEVLCQRPDLAPKFTARDELVAAFILSGQPNRDAVMREAEMKSEGVYNYCISIQGTAWDCADERLQAQIDTILKDFQPPS